MILREGVEMRWKKYCVEMDVTGITRKSVAEILSKQFQTASVFDLQNNGYHVQDQDGRIWRVLPSDDIKAERNNGEKVVGANYMYQVRLLSPFLYENEFPALEKVIQQLELEGAMVNDSTKMNVVLDLGCLENTERYQTNLQNLYESKGELFQKALDITFSEVAEHKKLENKNMLSFPYFKSTLHQKELLGYIQFAQAVSNYAENNKTVSQKKNQNQNDKFMMRTWLVRAGMVGEEYKFARKMLTQGLEGNSAWQKKVEVEGVQAEQTENTTQVPMDLEETNNSMDMEM